MLNFAAQADTLRRALPICHCAHRRARVQENMAVEVIFVSCSSTGLQRHYDRKSTSTINKQDVYTLCTAIDSVLLALAWPGTRQGLCSGQVW